MVSPKSSSDAYAVVAFVLLLASIALLMALRLGPGHPEPVPVVTCRILHAAAGELDGHEVHLTTEGMEPGKVPGEWVYRVSPVEPPVVVIRFAEPTRKLPAKVRGTVLKLPGGAVVLVGCRPD